MVNTGYRESKLIPRASMKFDMGGPGDVAETKIENDRLKTTLMILSQKLKVKDDEG